MYRYIIDRDIYDIAIDDNGCTLSRNNSIICKVHNCKVIDVRSVCVKTINTAIADMYNFYKDTFPYDTDNKICNDLFYTQLLRLHDMIGDNV